MTVLLQISDAHFGTELPGAVAALQALAQAQRPDVVVWTGDLTQRARPAQFEAARRFADSLRPARQVAMPGNHDIPLYDIATRLLDPYRRYRRCFGAALEPVLDDAGLLLLMVKTTRRWRHKDGEVSPQQVARIAARLRTAAPQQLRVVATHQPLHVQREQDRHNQLHAPRRTLAQWADAGADVVISGHTHHPACYRVAEAHRPVWVVHAGTAISHRQRGDAPNSVNLLRHDVSRPGLCVIERWDHREGADAFECVSRVEAGLAR
jgi:3',5'-cyclic AMP phosphodiesterase CpdA